MTKHHTFCVYVEDKPGVLNRVASLFRRRAFNIESLTVGHTETPGVSRMTILIDCDEHGALRLEANLYKLVNVLRVHDITAEQAVYRELVMIKVSTTTPESRVSTCCSSSTYSGRAWWTWRPTRSSSRPPARKRRSKACSMCCARTACWSWCGPGASAWCAARAAS